MYYFIYFIYLFSPASAALNIKLDGNVQQATNWFQEQLLKFDTALNSSSQHDANAFQVLPEGEPKPKTVRRPNSDDDDDDYSSSSGDNDSNDGNVVKSTMTTTKRRDVQSEIPYTTKPTIPHYTGVKTTKRDVNARADYDVDSDSDKHDSDISDYNLSSDSEDNYGNNVAVTMPILIETTRKTVKKIEKEFIGALKHWVDTKIGKKKGHKVQRIQNNDGSSKYKAIQEKNFNPGLIPPFLESLKNKTEEEAIETFDTLVEKYSNQTQKLHDIHQFLENVKNKTEEEAHSIIDQINATAQGLVEHVKNDTEHHAQNIISEMNNTAQEWIENAKNETQNAAENTFNQFVNQSHQMIEEVINKTENQIEELKNQTGLQIEELKNHTGSQIEELKNHTGSQIEELKNKTVNEVDKINTPTTITVTVTDQLEELKPPQNILEDVINETLHIVEEQLTAPDLSTHLLSSPIPSHKHGQDEMIKAFTTEILDRTLQLFDDVMKRSSHFHWKNRIKQMSRGYRSKFEEYLSSTKKHTIRTKYGPKKAISNAINVSNRLINQLMEYASHDMKKKGLIYNNMIKMLRTALHKEKGNILKQACKKFGVCNNQVNPFLNFVVDVTTAMLSVPNGKFKTAFRSLTAAAKKTDFFLGYKTKLGIIRTIKHVEGQNVNVQKGIVMILKNIFANRNTPIEISNKDGLGESKLRSTLALHEIINIFEDEAQDYGGYKQERNEIIHNLNDWVRGRIPNIDPTMSRFVIHIQNVISNLDKMSRSVLINNAKLLFS